VAVAHFNATGRHRAGGVGITMEMHIPYISPEDQAAGAQVRQALDDESRKILSVLW